MSKKFLFTIFLILLSSLGLINSLITPVAHKPVYLQRNHEVGTAYIDFRFEVSNDIKSVYNGYVFAVELPKNSFTLDSSVVGFGCDIFINKELTPGFSPKRNAIEDPNTLFCEFSGRDSRGIAINNKQVTIRIKGISFTRNFYDAVAISLQSSLEANRITFARNPAFKIFSVYNSYEELQSEASWKVSDVVIVNNTPSLSCTAPCNTLYPFSTYDIEFTNEITKYIDISEVAVVVGFDDVDTSGANYSVSSSAFSSNDVRFSALTGTSTGLKLDEYLERGRYEIQNINENLEPGRKFKLRIRGFQTKEFADMYGTEFIRVVIFWKNTNSILSFFNVNIMDKTKIQKLGFKTATASGSTEDVSKSVSGPYSTEIFENGSFQLKFNLKVPKVESDGKILIEHVSTANTVFSFVPSTCDFSDNVDSAFLNIGIRPICSPKDNNSFNNGSIRRVSHTVGEGENNSSFSFPLLKSSERDVLLRVWGFANRCNNQNFEFPGFSHFGFDNILSSSVAKSFPLLFRISYITKTGNVVVQDEFYTASLDCFKNLSSRRISDSNHSLDLKPLLYTQAQTWNKSISNNTNKDYLLYRELTNWNFADVTHNDNQLLYSRNVNGFTEKYLSEYTNNSNLGFFIDTTGGVFDTLPLPVVYDETNNSVKYNAGNLELSFYSPYTIQNDANSASCYLKWFVRKSDNTILSPQAISVSNQQPISHFKFGSISAYQLKTLKLNTVITDSGTNVQHTMPDFFGQIQQMYDGSITTNSIGFYTDCHSIKGFNTVSFKSIYSPHVDFRIKYNRRNLDDTADVNTRTIRLLKFFPGNRSFSNSSNSNKVLNTQIAEFWYADQDYTTSTNDARLCILSISGSLFDLLSESDNTILLTFLNTKIPVVDDFSEKSVYPVAGALSTISIYPGYSAEPIANFVSENNNQNNGYMNFVLGDDKFFNSKSPLNYFGSTLLIKGITSRQVSKLSSGNLAFNNDDIYIPLHCPDRNVNKTTYQNLISISVNFINLTISGAPESNFITTVTTNTAKNFSYLNKFNNNSHNFENKEFNVKFDNYRHFSSEVNSPFEYTMKYSSNVDQASRANWILAFTNLNESTKVTETALFFGHSYFKSALEDKSIAGISYKNMYLYASNTTFSPSNLFRFSRPVYGTQDNYYLRLQGYFSRSNLGQTYHNHVKNEQFNQVVANPDTELFNDNTTINRFTMVFRSIGTYYVNDYGANFTFEANVFTDFTFNNAEMKISTDANFRKSQTKCVFTLNPEKECTIVDNNEVICSDIKVEADIKNTVLISCYNVLTNNSGIFRVRKDNSYFKVPNYINYSLKEDYVINYISSFAAKDISTVTPKIDSINFTQVRQNRGLGVAFLRVDLGRGLRIGQKIIIKGAISDLYINRGIPNCWYSFTNTFNYLDDLSVFDDYTGGNYFLKTCSVNSSIGEDHEITIDTLFDYIPVGDIEFSRFLVIRLEPIYALDLAIAATNGYYSITSYLLDDVTTKICANAKVGSDRDTFPPISPGFTNVLYSPVPATETGLCDLVDIFPRISSLPAVYTFRINLTNATAALTAANTSGTNKVINEVSIFFDRMSYQRNEEIVCSMNNTTLPCNWTKSGFINIRLYTPLTPESVDNLIQIRGIFSPIKDASTNENTSNFNCSLNYNFFDVRENILIGLGSNTITTFQPSDRGNLINVESEISVVSNSTPRERADYNFRFNLDNTGKVDSITLADRTFELTEDKKPVVYVKFPSQYLFDFNLGSITVSLSRTDFDLETSNAKLRSYLEPETVNIESVKVLSNYIQINLSQSLQATYTTAYYDLKIRNAPNPDWTTNTSDFIIAVLNDNTNPDRLHITYPNLNNRTFNLVNEAVDNNDFWQGPRFSFSDSSKYIIDPILDSSLTTNSHISINPGRYSIINFALTGSSVHASTRLFLNNENFTLGSTFKTIENYITLDSNHNRSGSLRLGVPCNTLYGDYFVKFDLSDKVNFFKLPTLRVTVNRIFENLEQIKLRPLGSSTSDKLSEFTLYPSAVMIEAAVSKLPFEDVQIKLSNSTELYSNFRNTTSVEEHTIKAKSNSAYFRFVVDSYSQNTIKIKFTSDNRCYGFDTVLSNEVTFITSRVVANLQDLDLQNTFSYVNVPESSINHVSNQISVRLARTIPYTFGFFALICAEATIPSYDYVLNSYLVNNRLQADNVTSFPHSSLFQLQARSYYTEVLDERITFSNLKRGQAYNFVSWFSDFNSTNTTVISISSLSLPNFTNSSQMVELSIVDKMLPQYFKYTFTNLQTEKLIDRITLKTQEFLRNVTNANVVVFNNKSQSLISYGIEADPICHSNLMYNNGSMIEEEEFDDSIPDNTTDVEIIDGNSTNVNNTNNNTNNNNGNTNTNNSTNNNNNSTNNNTQVQINNGSRVRRLQTTDTSNTTTTNSTTNSTNSTNNNLTDEVNYEDLDGEDVFAIDFPEEVTYIKWMQSPTDPVVLNTPDLINLYYERFQLTENFRKTVEVVSQNTQNITLNGTMNLTQLEDIYFTRSYFNVFNITYDKTSEKLSFIPFSNYTFENCYWKIFDFNSTFTPAGKLMRPAKIEDLVDCSNNAEADGSITILPDDSRLCGMTTFLQSTNYTASYNVGLLLPGNYSVHFGCLSNIPLSEVSVTFSTPKFEVKEEEVVYENYIFYNCTINPEDPICFSKLLGSSWNILILLFAALFAF